MSISNSINFSTHTLQQNSRQSAITRILSAALEAADPSRAVTSVIQREDDNLTIGPDSIDLSVIDKVTVIAFGKAAAEMARAAHSVLGDRITNGLIVCKFAPAHPILNFELIIAGHPVPDERSLFGGKRILDILASSTERDLVLFLISGGGSALVTAPVEGITLANLQTTTSALLRCGASIDEINTLRRSLDQVKGGGMAAAAGFAKQYSLILSDVVNSPLEAIASGPTVPNPNQPSDALRVIEKFELMDQIPESVATALLSTAPKFEARFGKAIIIGSNEISANKAKQGAEAEGFVCDILTTAFQGEAAVVGKRMAEKLLAEDRRPVCLIAGGESTVTLGDDPGMGGRNLEVALAAAEELSGAQDLLFITLATDGDDGPTGAAGAVINGETKKRGELLGLDPQAFHARHASYDYFKQLDDLIITGPTGTNVNDLIFMFRF